MITFQKRQLNGSAQSGMTFIELIVVLLVMGILFGLGMGAFSWIKTAKINKAKVVLNGLKFQIMQFHTDTHQYPNTIFDLMNKPADPNVAQRWHKYVEDEGELTDPWGSVYQYQKNPAGAGANKRPFELYSWGPDGEGSTEGKIDVWVS